MAKLKSGTRIYGDLKIDGAIYDSVNAIGTTNYVLTSTGSSITWQPSGEQTWTRVTSSTQAVSKNRFIADASSGAFTITLPASPSTGDFIRILDGGNWSSIGVTVARNGSTIENVADDMYLNVGQIEVEFAYDGTTWQIYPSVGASNQLATVNDITNILYPVMVAGVGTGYTGSVSTSKLVFNASSGSLGIGITNPTVKLQVAGIIGFADSGTVSSNNIRIGDATTGCSITSSGNNNFFAGINAGTANTTGSNNVFIGQCAGCNNTCGSNNNFFGNNAGFANTTGNSNNFFGRYAGQCNTNGCYNNFFGRNAGRCNLSGCNNTFFGRDAGCTNTTGNNNIFIGCQSGACSSTGITGGNNNAMGVGAGASLTSGANNNFFGCCAGANTTTGCHNNFLGNTVGLANTGGGYNNFFGNDSGRCNTSGSYNNFFGCRAGQCNTTGSNNNFFGQGTGRCNTTGSYNNFFGFRSGCSNTTGCYNVAIGASGVQLSSTTGSCQMVIGATPTVTWMTGTSAGVVTFPSNVQSTSTTTGTVVVTGGVGVSSALYVGGSLNVTGGTTTDFINYTTVSSSSTTTPYVVDSSLYGGAYWSAAYTSGITLQVGNLTTGKAFYAVVRNTSASARILVIQAGVSTAYSNVPCSVGAGAASTTQVTLAANTGQTTVMLLNLNGNIVGSIN